MRKEYSSLYLRLDKEERAILDTLAAEKGVPSSTYVRDMLGLNDLKDGDEITIAAGINNDGELRDTAYKVYLTKSEREQLEAEASNNHISVSTLIRRKALSAKKIIRIDVYDNDIIDLEHRILPQINNIFGVIKALRVQSKLHDSQADRIEALLDEINKNLRFMVNRVRKNRNTLRSQRIRELTKRVNAAIETETDSLASFDDDDAII